MKSFISLVVATIIFSSCCGSKSTFGSSIQTNDLPDLQDIVTRVQYQYEQAIDSLAKAGINDVEVTEAEVTFKVAKELTGSGSIKVLVVKGGKEWTRTNSSSVTFKLAKEKNKAGAGEGKTKLVGNNLKDIIFLAAKTYSELENPLSGLIKDGFDINIVFSINSKTEGGISFEVWLIGADASVDVTRSIEHELKLSFAYKKK